MLQLLWCQQVRRRRRFALLLRQQRHRDLYRGRAHLLLEEKAAPAPANNKAAGEGRLTNNTKGAPGYRTPPATASPSTRTSADSERLSAIFPFPY